MNWLEPLYGNRRLRIGLALIAWLLAVNALLDWRTHIETLQAEYRRSIGQLARLSPRLPLEVWQQRAAEGREALQQARALLWRNGSAGLAQAQVQDWLTGTLRRAGAQAPAVRVAEPDAGVRAGTTAAGSTAPAAAAPAAGLAAPLAVRARIEFGTDPAVMLALLAAFNDAEHRVAVDSLVVRPGRTDMGLTFWYALEPAAAAPRAANAAAGAAASAAAAAGGRR